MIKTVYILLIVPFLILANSLDDKIAHLQKAPKEQRYKIMNSIKLELIKLNSSQRELYLHKLFKKHRNRKHIRNNHKKIEEMQNINKTKHFKHQYNKHINEHNKNHTHINVNNKDTNHKNSNNNAHENINNTNYKIKHKVYNK